MKENINKNIPKLPGIYKFINHQNKIIYVGKSKNLHNIELISKNFLQEIKKLIHIRAY